MREYTSIIKISVIASIVADNDHEANVRAWGETYVENHDFNLHATYGVPPQLLPPHIIGLVAYQATCTTWDRFKVRSFEEAAREINLKYGEGSEVRPLVFPPNYPGLPS